MSTQVLYLSQIRTALRDVQFEHVAYTAGQYHDVLIINRTWVFRFPRTREGVTRLIEEARLLEALRGKLPLPIPDPQFQRFEPPVPGLAFLGYNLLPGEPLSTGALDEQADEWVRGDIARQLARFLRSLHATPLSEVAAAFPNGAEARDTRRHWEEMYHEVREKLMPAMRPDARRDVSLHFEAYLDDRSLHDFTPCLRHGDFGGSNLLWDRQQGAVTAVLDFSFCAPGDPAVDLASAWTLGERFFQDLLPSYCPDPALRGPLQNRARFYRGLFALEEALDGLRLNDQEAYRRGMEEYV